jgi:hypothetical protein
MKTIKNIMTIKQVIMLHQLSVDSVTLLLEYMKDCFITLEEFEKCTPVMKAVSNIHNEIYRTEVITKLWHDRFSNVLEQLHKQQPDESKTTN